MTEKVQGIRGMPDILPVDVPLWQQFESYWRQLAANYGYQEIRLPIVETTVLFKRSIGEVTDIVEKEMFSFESRDGESLSLRPEGTAGCVRAALEHNLLYHQVQRLWYQGPMFRYERPQKGRYRQFNQVGIEAFGLEGPDIDVEQILMIKRLWQWLGVENVVSLRINSLGSLGSRQHYREKLITYFSQYYQDLDPDSQRRLHTNPLRILDSKNPALINIIASAPSLQDHLDSDSKAHFETLLQYLSDANIAYEVNPNLVRGLDYYNRTVYEWVTDKLGAQGAVCSGGRYDSLVEQLGGTPTKAVGFALGVERILLLQRALGQHKEAEIDIYLISSGIESEKTALLFAEQLRNNWPQLRLIVHCGGGSFKTQFKKADQSGAKIAFILGETEIKSATVSIKWLREKEEQISISREDVDQFLTKHLGR